MAFDRHSRLAGREPKGQVPALSGVLGNADGAAGVLTEAHSVLVHLARTNPALNLLSLDAADEARAIEWMNWLASDVHVTSFGQLWRPQRFVSDPALFPNVRARGAGEPARALRLHRTLAKRRAGLGSATRVRRGRSVPARVLSLGRADRLGHGRGFPAWTHLAAVNLRWSKSWNPVGSADP